MNDFMTNEEWEKLSAENRHRFNVLVAEIQRLTTENAMLRNQLTPIDPATGTGAFLNSLENPPYGEK